MAIDAGTDKIAGMLSLDGRPEAGAADGHGMVYINIEDKSEVVAFDSKTLTIVRRWALAPCIYRNDLGKLLLRSPSGRLFPLRAVARIDFVGGQPEITRDNLAQVVDVTAEIGGGHDLGTTLDAVKRLLDRPGALPRGVDYTVGGEYQQQQIAFAGMVKVFAAAAVAELILLLFLYNEPGIPVIVLASALISSGAVFIGLWITGTEFNITAMMGMVMIVGIATEMAIFYASEYRALEATLEPQVALRRAALNRLRPITMSTLAMILALLPLGAAVSGSGDQMLQPLAIAIIAGMIVQLPLVLIALPVGVGLTRRGRSRAAAT